MAGILKWLFGGDDDATDASTEESTTPTPEAGAPEVEPEAAAAPEQHEVQ
jgi:hypothetical protein